MSHQQFCNMISIPSIPNYFDIFQRLPEHIHGYILTYFKTSEYEDVYKYVQGQINVRIYEIPWSRSNLIFTEKNQLAITTMQLKFSNVNIDKSSKKSIIKS